MRGDDGQRTDVRGGDEIRERTGPRHAAPRKSLLTKLHLPSGKKALALAAMPTAVFVGMGLTPKLALADERIENPFAPGPCVTRSDEPSESASPEPTPSPSATAQDGKDDPSGQDGAATPTPSAEGPAPGTEKDPAAGEKPGTDTPARSADGGSAGTPSATPTPTASKNPLDPLGIGDALKDLFDGPDDEKPEEPAAPSPSPTPEAPGESEKPEAPAGGAGDKADETSDEAADAIREAAEKAGEKVEELDEDVKGLDPKKDEDIPDGAKPRFPCPEADPDALAAAELEPGIPLLPSAPWTLESTRLTLRGLDYHGIVEVKKADGSIKKVLKFTATSIDIKDLHQLTEGPAGTTGHVKSRPGSTSEIRDGEVTMYTEELKGNLFGLIPVTFSPQTPPPLNVPIAVFTNVKVVQAGQFGGTLTVPGLKNYLEGGKAGN
ncbi:hypothetical protein [Streptomyces sp. V2I9]|uniref:hypothetical protein n=1 Tax=Streptomyces sp. V2I9 TaxID=3042304 RepID=UPI00277E9C6B|nr:hypothetical protein [Streptomyces sp. V2I9]MDQ0987141.1 hypothetical protein [Streptomyces sp. V2I9]